MIKINIISKIKNKIKEIRIEEEKAYDSFIISEYEKILHKKFPKTKNINCFPEPPENFD